MPNYPYYNYQPQYYQPPMQDHLAQLRQQQYQPVQAQQMYQQQASQTMIWVAGEQEAMAYLIAPNSAVALWDSTAPVIYLKQADASGKPSIKIYDLVERTQRPAQAAQAPAVEYAPLSRLEALEARIDAMATTKTSTRKVAVKEDAE